jgi:HAMP domain-containing protein
VLAIIVTAVLCAACTVGVAAWYVSKVLEPRLQKMVDARSEALAQTIEARVKAGVEAGIQSGIEKAASADTLVRATRSATRSGASLVEDGLNVLLGTPRRDKDR